MSATAPPAPSAPTSATTVRFLEIDPEHSGQRIDNYLFSQLKGVPKSHVYRILRSGEVRVNKGRIKPTYRLQEGDVVRLPPTRTSQEVEPATPPTRVLEILRQAILHQDAKLLVLNKPAGLAVHGGSGVRHGVIEGLRALFPEARFLELVHRLDRDTSGCLLVAKKASTLRQLHGWLRENRVDKTYLALVRGRWPERATTVRAPLSKNTLRSGERVARVDPEEGKAAETRFVRREILANATLLEAKPVTGRTHQIRVHAAHHGHPIAGDEKYGDEGFNRELREKGLKRLFLHAEQISLPADGEGGKPMAFHAPLAESLEWALRRLRTNQ